MLPSFSLETLHRRPRSWDILGTQPESQTLRVVTAIARLSRLHLLQIANEAGNPIGRMSFGT